MAKPSWQFPKNEAGETEGKNNPSMAHFTDKDFVREVIQNSLDERVDKQSPVRVEFQTIHLRKELFGADELYEHFQCAHLEMKKYDPKWANNFRLAMDRLHDIKDNVPCLRIMDSNTNGASFLQGDLALSRDTKWGVLVKGAGANKKDSADALGSYGVGKAAPFKITPLRTVLYATAVRDQSGKLYRCYQGKSILVSHVDKEGIERRGTGYFGTKEFGPIIENSTQQFPGEFVLSEPGLAIYIPYPSLEGERARIVNVIDNFFFAFTSNQLEVKIEDKIINQANLDNYNSYLREKNDKEEVLRFIKVARREPVAKKSFLGIGQVNLRLRKKEQNEGSRREIALVRNAGMMISKKWGDIRKGLNSRSLPQHWYPFTAIIECLSDGVDSYIRQAETPRHDQISLDQIDDLTERSKAREVFKRMSNWLFDEMQKHVDRDLSDSETKEIEELRNILSVTDPVSRDGLAEDGTRDQDFFVSEPVQRSQRPRSSRRVPRPEPEPGPRPDPPQPVPPTPPIPRPIPPSPEESRVRFRRTPENDSHAILMSFSPRSGSEVIREIRLFAMGEQDRRMYPVGLRQVMLGDRQLDVQENAVISLRVGTETRLTLKFLTREPVSDKALYPSYGEE